RPGKDAGKGAAELKFALAHTPTSVCPFAGGLSSMALAAAPNRSRFVGLWCCPPFSPSPGERRRHRGLWTPTSPAPIRPIHPASVVGADRFARSPKGRPRSHVGRGE